ncbi:PQQ-binding-like beta-propeller repeat protein [uncultured Nocardioides sp.]|uniref:PQQ-binding-like beta-propeller repeat protein n=1 Tax=uncultured Nocardioides sp. TaxID=198441 RepID=UPI002620EDF0|nr:PQQ-binding-like beta-propeller repeat protein [uncultured Nocardioides sp.]
MTAARPLVALLAALAPALVACSAVPFPGDDLPELADLEPAWEADGVAPYVTGDGEPPALWRTDDLLVVVSAPVRENLVTVTALDAGAGTATWTASLDGTLCGTSSDVTDDGLGVMLFRPDPNAECVGVAALDTAAGEVAWTTELEVPRRLGRDRQAIVPGVGVGETSVNATAGCGRVTRLDPADGTPLETVGALPGGFGCSGPGGVGGSLVAWTEGRGRDAVTILRDTDSSGPDAVLWRRPAAGVVEAVPSTDPLLLDRSDATGRLLRAVGPGGATTDVGLRMGYGVGGFTTTAAADDVVAGRYDTAEEVVALDVASGDVAWTRPQVRYGPQRRLVGAWDDELVWVQPFSDPDAPGEDRVWVTTSDPRDPDSGRTLGSITTGFLGVGDQWTVAGDLLLNSSSSRTTAYDLAAAEPGATDGVEEVPAAYADDIDDSLDWAEDDVRPVEVIGACRAVSDATLAAIGLSTELPEPADCRWTESTPGGSASLDVTVTAATPSSEGSAADSASDQVTGTEPPFGVAREVDLGDGATLVTDGGVVAPTPTEESAATALLEVRRGNVVATVTLTSSGTSSERPRRPPLERLETLAAEVARDVLDSVDVDLEVAAPEDDGPATAAPTGGCADSPALARLVPDGVALPVRASSDGRIRICERRSRGGGPYPDARTRVSAEAVGPGLGSTAVEAATARLDAAGGQVVDGPGDQAVLVDGGTYPDARTLLVRADNLVVTVAAERDDDGEIRLDDLRRVAARLLADARG